MARTLSHMHGRASVRKRTLPCRWRRGDWVLSIDADERVSPALAREIKAAIAAPRADAYEIPRITSFLGRDMRGAGGRPDYVLRLFRRGAARFTDDLVHERVVCDGQIARLTTPLHHHSVTRLEDAISRIDRYSTAGAEMLIASGRRVSFMSGIGHGLWTFIRVYFLAIRNRRQVEDTTVNEVVVSFLYEVLSGVMVSTTTPSISTWKASVDWSEFSWATVMFRS